MMYHTFPASTDDVHDNAQRPTTGTRRISTNNACVECRRRKIRCDGGMPCSQCQWYQHPETCAYQKPAQRIIPSRKLVQKLQSEIEQYTSVLRRLYPGKDIGDISKLSRDGLIDLAMALSTTPSKTSESALDQTIVAKNLQTLQKAPLQDFETDRATVWQCDMQDISDHTESLSITTDAALSSMGVSFTEAAIKAVRVLTPLSPQGLLESTEATRSSLPSPHAYKLDISCSHDVAFCKIVTRAQDQLGATSPIDLNRLFSIDADLEKWHQGHLTAISDGARVDRYRDSNYFLPSETVSSSSTSTFDCSQPAMSDKSFCPDTPKSLRGITHWKYQTFRMLIYHPVLLATSLKRTPHTMLSTEEKLAVHRSRITAGQIIADINDAQDNFAPAWTAPWLMYQAVMVPLLSLASVLSTAVIATPVDSQVSTLESSHALDGDHDVEKWRTEVEVVLAFLNRTTLSPLDAHRRQVVQQLFDGIQCLDQRQCQNRTIRRKESLQPDQQIDPHKTEDGTFGPTTNLPWRCSNAQEHEVLSARAWVDPTEDAAAYDFWNGMPWEALSNDLRPPVTTGVDIRQPFAFDQNLLQWGQQL